MKFKRMLSNEDIFCCLIHSLFKILQHCHQLMMSMEIASPVLKTHIIVVLDWSHEQAKHSQKLLRCRQFSQADCQTKSTIWFSLMVAWHNKDGATAPNHCSHMWKPSNLCLTSIESIQTFAKGVESSTRNQTQQTPCMCIVAYWHCGAIRIRQEVG